MTPTRQHPADSADSGLQVARAVARRVDKLEPAILEHGRHLRELSKGLAVALASQQRQPAGQPDWLRCRNPDQAKAILTGVSAWLEDCGRALGVTPTGCWPWHPQAVAILLAGSEHYRATYAGDSTLAVVELVTRYAGAINTRATHAIGDLCNATHHRVGDAPFGYDVAALDRVAIWWATSREGLPPGLTPRD